MRCLFRFCFYASLVFLFPIAALADEGDFVLNKVSMQLHAEKWVTTQTALVNVSVNATVQTQTIDKVQSAVTEHLKKLSAKGEWHIISLNRREEKSGLESIQMVAEARLEQNELADLRDKAKLISTPGETFSIDNIQFVPGKEEFRQAENDLRNDIYTQARKEIDVLNKLYPEQKYYLHTVNFILPSSPMPVAAMYMKNEAVTARAPALSVGNKRELTAEVVIGSLADMTRKGLSPNL